MAKTSIALRTLGAALLTLAALRAVQADEPVANAAPPSGALPALSEARGAVPIARPAIGEPDVLREPEPPAVPMPPAPPALDVVSTSPAAVPEAPPAPPANAVVGSQSAGLLAPSSCCPPPCCPPPCGTTPCCDPCRKPSLDLQIHGAWVNELEGPLTVDSGLANQVLWDPLDYGVSLGGRAAYHFAVGRQTVTVGGTYWGTWDDDDATVGTLTSTAVPGGALIVSPVFPVTYEAETRLYGLEADLSSESVCTACFRAGWGYGLRYMRFDEEGTFTFFPTAGPPNGQGHADVDNALLAAQLVGHAAWSLGDRLELRARGAAFAGWLHQQVETSSAGAFIAAGPDAEDDSIGFGGEVELEARWHLSRGFSIGVGYGLLVLFDQARAEQAFDLTQTATGVAPGRIDEDTIFAQRVFLGVTFTF